MLMEQQLLAIKAVRRADANLVTEMKATRNALAGYLKERAGKSGAQPFPNTPENVEKMKERLSSALSANPYEKEPILKSELQRQEAGSKSRIRVFFDPTVSANRLTGWRKKPPEAFKASAGTITVIHNGYDFAVIWGASIDGRPVRDGSEARLLSLRVGD